MDEFGKKKLTNCIEDIRRYKSIYSFDEADTKLKIVTRIFGSLGWNMFSDEVKPEYPVENKWVDYSLRIKNENYVFVEVKNPKQSLDNSKHQKQLLDYSFKLGVASAILTNGISWWFYLPLYPGKWENRRCCIVDIMADKVEDVVISLIQLLSKETVGTGTANKMAESMIEGHKKTLVIKRSLPEAWNKIIKNPDKSLITLLEKTTVEICDFNPDNDETKQVQEEVRLFIAEQQSKWLLPTVTYTTMTVFPSPTKKVEEKKEVTKAPSGSGSKKPHLVNLNNKQYELKHSYEILVLVANWLIDQGYLNLSECPITLSKSKKRYLVHSIPTHPTGKAFFAKVELQNGLYIEAHASTKTIIETSTRLLEKYGNAASTLSVLS